MPRNPTRERLMASAGKSAERSSPDRAGPHKKTSTIGKTKETQGKASE